MSDDRETVKTPVFGFLWTFLTVCLLAAVLVALLSPGTAEGSRKSDEARALERIASALEKLESHCKE